MAKPRTGFHDMFAQIPKALWEALNAEAEQNLRSATTQLIWILRERYPGAATMPASPPAAEPHPKKRKPK